MKYIRPLLQPQASQSGQLDAIFEDVNAACQAKAAQVIGAATPSIGDLKVNMSPRAVVRQQNSEALEALLEAVARVRDLRQAWEALGEPILRPHRVDDADDRLRLLIRLGIYILLLPDGGLPVDKDSVRHFLHSWGLGVNNSTINTAFYFLNRAAREGLAKKLGGNLWQGEVEVCT